MERPSKGKHRSMVRLLIFVFATLSVASPATADRYRDCVDADVVKRLKACTQLIKRGRRESASTRAVAYHNRATAYATQKKYKKAINDYTAALKLRPKSVTSLVARASAYNELGQYDKALSDVTKSISIRPTNVHSYDLRSSVYFGKGMLRNALADISQAIALDGDDAAHYQWRGVLRFATYDFEGAIKDFSAALKLDPQALSGRVWRARGYWATRELDAALKDAIAALEIDATNEHALVLAGRIRLSQDEYSDASDYFKKLIKTHPDNPVGYWGIGASLSKRLDDLIMMSMMMPDGDKDALEFAARYKDVTKLYSQAISKDPKFGTAYIYRGFRHYQNSDYGAALADFNMAIEVLAESEKTPKRTEDAAFHFFDRVEAIRRRAYTYQKLERWADAANDYEEAMRLQGEVDRKPNAIDLQRLAWAWFKAGKAAYGLRIAEESVKLDPESLKGWNTLGSIYNAIGNRDQAIDAFTRALAVDSEDETARQQLKRLTQ